MSKTKEEIFLDDFAIDRGYSNWDDFRGQSAELFDEKDVYMELMQEYADQFNPQEDTATQEELTAARETYDKLEKAHLIGKTFEIVDDTTNHKIMIGVEVKVVSKAYGSEYWLVQSKANETAFVTKKDLGL